MDARLIVDEPARGSWNMAVDEVLLAGAGQGGGAALRFYQWNEPTVSLGYFQKIESRGQHPPSAKLPVVRRTTGGGAIVHHRELTYSFVTPIRDRFASSVQDFVKQFHEALIAALADFGIEARLCGDPANKTNSEPFLCFQRRSPLDVVVGPAKVVGSAQRRHGKGLLQHGSVLLGSSSHAETLPGLNDLAGTSLGCGELVEAWSQRLGKQFGFRFTASSWTDAESTLARSVERRRFRHPNWTGKR